MFNQH